MAMTVAVDDCVIDVFDCDLSFPVVGLVVPSCFLALWLLSLRKTSTAGPTELCE